MCIRDSLNPLVTTVSYYDVYMDPTVAKQELFDSGIDSLAQGISDLFHRKEASDIVSQLKKARANGSRWVLVQKQVTNEQRKALRELPIFNEGRFKGGIIDGQIKSQPFVKTRKASLLKELWDITRSGMVKNILSV